MNILDWFAAQVSPRWAVSRLAARSAMEELRAYDAERKGRRQSSWRTPRSSARSEVAKGAGPVRDAVRDLVRNNGYAARALRTLVSSAVGTGITAAPQIEMMGRRQGQQVRDCFDRWVDNCDWAGEADYYGNQVLAARTMFESGEALIRFHTLPFDGSTRIAPVRMQVLEPDFIDVSKTGTLNGGGYIDRGIQYDAEGRKQGYWLHQVHPGDISRYLLSKFESVYVPRDSCVQVFDLLRPGQDRGVSMFAGAVMPLKDLSDLFEAELMRKRLESCLALFITSSDSDAPVIGSRSTDADGNKVTKLAPGMINRLRPGESVSTLTPQTRADDTPFIEQLLFLAAAAGGTMFEHMTGNMKHVNYSSYRVGAHDYARWVEQLQWITLVPRLCRVVEGQWLRAARAAVLLPNVDVRLAHTPPPATTSPDPVKDATANQMNLRMGLADRGELNGRAGWSDSERMERVARDLAASDAIGVRFDGDPRKNLKGNADAETDQKADPAAD